MLTITHNQNVDTKNIVYIIREISNLPDSLSDDEKSFLTDKLKKDFDAVPVHRLGNVIFVVKVSDEANYKNIEKARKAGAKITTCLNKHKIEEVQVQDLTSKQDFILPLAEGMALNNYQFLKYFKDADKKKNSLTKIHISTTKPQQEIDELIAGVDANAWAKDMVNEPSSFLNAVELAKQIEEKATSAGVRVDILDQMKIESLKMGGLLAVNKGSVDPATFTVMEWKPDNAKNERPVILVGKGIVYDTGGLSLKPTANSMDFMKTDMGGAAAIAGAIIATASANIPVHVIGLVPSTDNRPGGNAYAPGDVIKMHNGLNVEVLNTDAEGRMVLADALSYAQKYNPELVIDAATLTGAAVAALGGEASAIMGTASEETFDKLTQSGNNTYERVVTFPFFDEYDEYIKSDIADLKNIGGSTAGTITAGKFLQHFTDYPWIHADIAPTAWRTSAKDYLPKGATASGVRLFFDFLKNYN